MKTIKVKEPCVVLETPEYPDDIEWRTCDWDGFKTPCLTVEDARKLGIYLAATLRYHESIEQTCGEL